MAKFGVFYSGPQPYCINKDEVLYVTPVYNRHRIMTDIRIHLKCPDHKVYEGGREDIYMEYIDIPTPNNLGLFNEIVQFLNEE